VHSVEGTAFRIRQLLNSPEMAKTMGERAKEFIRKNFLITRQTRDYLSVWYALNNKGKNIIELL
jgi:trehalose synthase